MKLFGAPKETGLLRDLAKALELSPIRWAGGTVQGRRAELFVELSASRGGIAVAAGPITPLPEGLCISKAKDGGGITLADDELSARVRVECLHPAAAIRLVRMESVRSALLRATPITAFEVRDGWVVGQTWDVDPERAREQAGMILNVALALSDGAKELALQTAHERERVKAEGLPEIPARKFVTVEATEAQSELENDLRREARARVVWGDSSDEVIRQLMKRGASFDLAKTLDARERRVREDELRRAFKNKSGTSMLFAAFSTYLLRHAPAMPTGPHGVPLVVPFAVLGYALAMYTLGLGLVNYVMKRETAR